jgi:hypothetical protein
MTTPQAPVVFTEFDGNVEFYNDPRYRAANKLFYTVIDLLKQCGMEHNQACGWIRCWGYEDEGD